MDELKETLNRCDNIDEMFTVLQSHFDLTKPISVLNKRYLVDGLLGGISLINPPKLKSTQKRRKRLTALS